MNHVLFVVDGEYQFLADMGSIIYKKMPEDCFSCVRDEPDSYVIAFDDKEGWHSCEISFQSDFKEVINFHSMKLIEVYNERLYFQNLRLNGRQVNKRGLEVL